MSAAAEANPGLFTLADGLKVGLSPGDPAGVICTRNAGALEFEASLQWPPGTDAALVFTGGLPRGESVLADLEESVAGGRGRIRGGLFSPYEEELRAALDEALRDLACAAALYEAALTVRVLRSCRPLCARAEAVESVAQLLWGAGLRVSFGASHSPAPEGADVTVGCRGAEERLAKMLAALVASPVERRGVAG